MKKALLGLLVGTLLAGTAGADELATGSFTITETGHGRFRCVDGTHAQYLLYMARGVTRFEPIDWVMCEGDQVYVEYWATFRNRPTPTCTLIRLDKAGPKTAALTNPLPAQVEEMGRIGIRVRQSVGDQLFVRQFSISRSTKYVPAGWIPQPGESVMIHFTSRPATFGWGHILIADTIERQ